MLIPQKKKRGDFYLRAYPKVAAFKSSDCRGRSRLWSRDRDGDGVIDRGSSARHLQLQDIGSRLAEGRGGFECGRIGKGNLARARHLAPLTLDSAVQHRQAANHAADRQRHPDLPGFRTDLPWR